MARRRSTEGDNRDCEGNSETLYFRDLTEEDLALLDGIAECFKAVSNRVRLRILSYCLTPRTFSEIIFGLRLNAGSFKFHEDILEEAGMTEKRNSTYQTTELGKRVLDFAELFYRKKHENTWT